jgi:hypothetical protein
MSQCPKCNKFREEPSLYFLPDPSACQCEKMKYSPYMQGNLYPPVRYGDKRQFYSDESQPLYAPQLYSNVEQRRYSPPLYSNVDQRRYGPPLYSSAEQSQFGQQQGVQHSGPGKLPPVRQANPSQPMQYTGEAIMRDHLNEDTNQQKAWMVVGYHLNWSKGVSAGVDRPPASVRYLRTAEERAPYKVSFAGGKLLLNGIPMDTTNARAVKSGLKDKQVMGRVTGAFIYVMCVNGQIYAADASDEYKNGGVFDMEEFRVGVNNTRNLVAKFEGREATTRQLEGFHHSSFLEGNEVACAGEIYVKQGNLIKVDNNSGHYVPAPATLMAVADRLHRNGVNTEQVKFGYNLGNGNKFAPIKYWHGKSEYLAAKSQWPAPVNK